MAAALIDSENSQPFSFRSAFDGGRNDASEDVFGMSMADVNIWAEESPWPEEDSPWPEETYKVESKSASARNRRDPTEKKRSSKDGKKKKRSTDPGIATPLTTKSKPKRSSKRSQRTTKSQEEGVSPDDSVGDLMNLNAPKKSSKRAQRTTKSQEEDVSQKDKVGDLMKSLRRENDNKEASTPRRTSSKARKKVQVSGSPSRLKQKLVMEDKSIRKSPHLPPKAADRAYGSGFRPSRNDRQSSVKASLMNFLDETAANVSPKKIADRSVHSAPAKSHRPKLRSKRTVSDTSSRGGPGEKSGRIKRGSSSHELRSVVSSPAPAPDSLSERCQKLKLLF
jgi:hypothetical protein